MKKAIFIYLVIFSISVKFLYAQAPQGINYQAVAMNANGPLANRNISLQLSVVDSIANGTILYTETHNITTDASGTFSVVIGNGIVTQGNFLTINWGKNYKWLKTEIDTLGGSNFVLMGITQFMSTPYSLYANKTKQIYADLEHPDGLNNANIVVVGITPYTVPMGKNLYVGAYGDNTLRGIKLGLDTVSSVFALSEGEVFNYFDDTIPCMIVDKTVKWITVNLLTNPIVVPVGKTFVICSVSSNPSGFYNPTSSAWGGYNLFLNGNQISNGNNWLSGPFIVPSGSTLTATLNFLSGKVFINGYFIDN